MDDSLFRMYIRDVILPLYSNSVMENGKVIKGPVFLKTDSGPGRFKEDMEDNSFLEHMHEIGLNIILSHPNGTSVHAELDQIFGTYKGFCRTRTLDHFAEKLKYEMKDIEENNDKQKTSNEVEQVTNLKKYGKGFRNCKR